MKEMNSNEALNNYNYHAVTTEPSEIFYWVTKGKCTVNFSECVFVIFSLSQLWL